MPKHAFNNCKATLELHQSSKQCTQPYLALQQQLLILPQHELVLRLPLLVVRCRVKHFQQEGPHIRPYAGLQALQEHQHKKLYEHVPSRACVEAKFNSCKHNVYMHHHCACLVHR
jgi:hypothetical protein